MNPSPPSLALHQLSLYNTGRLTTEQVVAAFSARRPLLDRLLAELAAETPQSRAQHHLIVGQRGMGKTMLLARIAAELRREDALRAKFIPLVFAEEQYAVDRLSKFWLNCLDSLADAREGAGDTAAATALDHEVERLTALAASHARNDPPLAAEAYAAFAAAASRSGQRPVLLVDNLQLVFDRLESDQQHALRELLMRPGAPILVGASPSPPAATQDYGAAFYDHFKVHYLRPLSEDEMRDLLLHLAAAAGRADVRDRVLQHPNRLKVLRQLTGGNPRTTLTLFFLYAEDFAPSVFGDLEGLLDRVTPLYKARLEELTDQQQVIVSAAADHWAPMPAATLAERTALPPSTISAQLDRLRKIGVLERVELHGASKAGYQLAERFFNVWFLFRSASRRQRREIEFLTRFLETFYDPPERTRLARTFLGEDRISADRYLLSQALGDTLDNPGLQQELERHAQILALRDEAEQAYLDAISRNPKLVAPWNGLGNLYADILGRPQEAQNAYEHALSLDPNSEVSLLNQIFLLRDILGDRPAARRALDKVHALPARPFPDTLHLHDALFAAYDANWGVAREALGKALALVQSGLHPANTEDWQRATAVLIHLDYGPALLAFLDEHGHTPRLRPWVEAIRAHAAGDREALLNVAAEVRPTAEKFYDAIEVRLRQLPASTRRRPTPSQTHSKRRRQH